jgi:hypothetical protein
MLAQPGWQANILNHFENIIQEIERRLNQLALNFLKIQ